MTAVDTAHREPVLKSIEERPPGTTPEARLPAGKPLKSVQPFPLPVLSRPEEARPVHDEQAQKLLAVQARAEITGTGRIIDTWV